MIKTYKLRILIVVSFLLFGGIVFGLMFGFDGDKALSVSADEVITTTQKYTAVKMAESDSTTASGSLETTVTLSDNFGFAGIYFNGTNTETLTADTWFTEPNTELYAFVILNTGALQIIHIDTATGYSSCSGGFSLEGTVLAGSAYAEKFAAYKSGKNVSFRMRVDISQSEIGTEYCLVEGFIFDENSGIWERLCWADSNGSDWAWNTGKTPYRYSSLPSGTLGECGVLARGTNVKFENFQLWDVSSVVFHSDCTEKHYISISTTGGPNQDLPAWSYYLRYDGISMYFCLEMEENYTEAIIQDITLTVSVANSSVGYVVNKKVYTEGVTEIDLWNIGNGFDENIVSNEYNFIPNCMDTEYEFSLDIGEVSFSHTAWFISSDPVSGSFYFTFSYELPADPVKKGYTFSGWYTDEACSVPYVGSTVLSDTVLYAGWKINTYTVTYIDKYSGLNKSETVEWGTVLNLPEISRKGYLLSYWAQENGMRYDGFKVREDIVLTAHWNKEIYHVTFIVDGEVYATVNVPYGMALGKAAEQAEVSEKAIQTVTFESGLMSEAERQVEEFGIVDNAVVSVSSLTVSEKANNAWAIIGSVVGVVALAAVLSIAFGRPHSRKR